MTISVEELLRKATLVTGDFDGPGEAPLTIEQVDQFVRLAVNPQVMLPDVRTVRSNSAKWQESTLDFSGARIMKPGTEATELPAGDRVKPTTGIVEISTVLIRGQVPVSDEVMEDQVERAGFADTLTATIAEATGRDVEELMIMGDTGSGDDYLALQHGWIKLAQGAGGNVYVASGDAQDYQTIFRQLLTQLPDRYKRDIPNMRYYVPMRLEEKYRDILASRGTALGDLILTGTGELRYQGILIKGVPLIAITAGTPDTSYILLSHRQNLYAGWRRQITLETDRLPREGHTNFVVSARVNSQIGHVPATAIATTVDVEP